MCRETLNYVEMSDLAWAEPVSSKPSLSCVKERRSSRERLRSFKKVVCLNRKLIRDVCASLKMVTRGRPDVIRGLSPSVVRVGDDGEGG